MKAFMRNPICSSGSGRGRIGCGLRQAGRVPGAGAAMSLLLVLAAGCTTVPYEPDPDANRYRLRHGDVVAVEVYDEADLSRSFEVSDDGTISHPLLGRVPVVGKTAGEVEEELHRLLAADYLVNPRVSVSITSSSDRPIMIFGEVRNPGAYDVPAGRRVTLLQIIARAGGFTDIAAQDKVRIVRLVDGKEQSTRVRVSDLFRGRHGVTDVDLRAGDVITVPETLF